MSVTVKSPINLIQEGLVLLLERHGYKAQKMADEKTKFVLVDLINAESPYPEPDALPTVALIGGDTRKAQVLLAQGYAACVDALQNSHHLIQTLADLETKTLRTGMSHTGLHPSQNGLPKS